MSLTSRLTRIARLAIAPLKGFFTWKTLTTAPRYEPGTGFWAHMKEVARKDTILFFEPFTFAVKEFRQERQKGQSSR
jgi:hypothetical protein